MKHEVTKLANMLVLKKFNLPVNIDADQNPILFELFNQELISRKNKNQLLLPNFSRSNSVCVLSDYGGESPNSKYLTYTFTFVDYDFLSVGYSDAIQKLRCQYGLDNPYKEIAFKDLHYGPIFRSLDDYLKLLNNFVNGLVFTLIIDKGIISVFGDNSKNTSQLIAEKLKEANLGDWKGKTAEKLQRIIATISYFVNLLVPSGKKLFWMTDDDSIIANPKMIESVGNILNNAVHQFKDVHYPLVGYAKPFEKGQDPLFLDLLSISDLVAGSIEHYFTRKTVLDELTVSAGANKILMWLAEQGVALKKMCFMVNYKDENFYGSIVDFKLSDPPQNPEYIDILMSNEAVEREQD